MEDIKGVEYFCFQLYIYIIVLCPLFYHVHYWELYTLYFVHHTQNWRNNVSEIWYYAYLFRIHKKFKTFVITLELSNCPAALVSHINSICIYSYQGNTHSLSLFKLFCCISVRYLTIKDVVFVRLCFCQWNSSAWENEQTGD